MEKKDLLEKVENNKRRMSIDGVLCNKNLIMNYINKADEIIVREFDVVLMIDYKKRIIRNIDL